MAGGMAEGRKAEGPHRESRSICLPITEVEYLKLVVDPQAFRQWLNTAAAEKPELFSEHFPEGFQFKDRRFSMKQKLLVRRIELPLSSQIRRAVLGTGTCVWPQSHVLELSGMCSGAVQRRRHHDPPDRDPCAFAGGRTSSEE